MIENNAMKFYNVGLSYKKADVAMRSKFSVTKENQVKLLKAINKKGSEGVLILSTCNRVEIFGFAQHPFEFNFRIV